MTLHVWHVTKGIHKSNGQGQNVPSEGGRKLFSIVKAMGVEVVVDPPCL